MSGGAGVGNDGMQATAFRGSCAVIELVPIAQAQPSATPALRLTVVDRSAHSRRDAAREQRLNGQQQLGAGTAHALRLRQAELGRQQQAVVGTGAAEKLAAAAAVVARAQQEGEGAAAVGAPACGSTGGEEGEGHAAASYLALVPAIT